MFYFNIQKSRILRFKFELNDFSSFLTCEERIFAFFDVYEFRSIKFLILFSLSSLMQCKRILEFFLA